MKLNRMNIVLTASLVIAVMAAGATRVDYTQPNIEILPDMKYTPAWTAYASNPVFANGRTLQAPVTGTIARGQIPLHFEATKEDAIRMGDELVNRYHNSESPAAAEQLQASIQRGGETYRIFCICCHGATGAGDGPVTKRGFPPPPSLLTGKSPQMKDGQIFHVLTYGQNSMPDFTGQLSSDRRWDVINYIRSLQPQANADPAKPTGQHDEPVATETDNESTENLND